MKKNFKKGFTLIELLVVVAIIGILASVVLASLNSARAKGADAAVKSNLANARAQAELFYDSNGSKYMGTINTADDVCNTAGSVGSPAVKGIYQNILAAASATGATVGNEAAAGDATHVICSPAAGTWVVQAPLKTGGYWCVDSTGASVSEGSAILAGASKCI